MAPGTVHLILDGVGVHAAQGPALLIESAEAVVLRLAEGSFNTLLSGGGEPEEPGSAALYSAAALTVEGAGHLLVMAGSGNGVRSEGDVRVVDGVITVVAGGAGLHARNVALEGGHLTVFAEGDAVEAAGAGEAAGRVTLNGGELDLVAGRDGVRADTELRVRDGSLRVEASDDALASEGRLIITGGSLTLAAADDAVHAEVSVEVAGGELRVLASNEGLEAPLVSITGGTVLVTAVDDALNASGGVGPDDLLVAVSGGLVVLNAGSDAIDSNGSVRVTGGTLVLNGPDALLATPAIDRHYGRKVLLDGATVVAVGPLVLGREQGMDPASTQAVLYVDLGRRAEEGTVVTIRSEAGALATFVTPRRVWRLSFTSPVVTAGEEYEVWLGGTPVGAEQIGGLYEPPGVRGGEGWGAVSAR